MKLICRFCNKEIKTKKEKYVHVEDWNKEKMIKDLWSHLVCFNKAMNRDLTELEKMAQVMLKKAQPILAGLNPSQEEYELK